MKQADFDQAVEETTQYERDFAMQMMDQCQESLNINRELIRALYFLISELEGVIQGAGIKCDELKPNGDLK